MAITGDQTLLLRLWGNLLQNAVTYGKEGGHIWMKLSAGEGVATLQVRDDGVGMPDEQVERLNAQFGGVGGADMTQPCGGIALRNVNSRIRLLFGEQYGVTIYSTEGVGTDVEVTLPLITGKAKDYTT